MANPHSAQLALSIAGLPLIINGENNRFSLDFSPCHRKFIIPDISPTETNHPPDPGLIFRLIDAPDYQPEPVLSLLCKNEIWELHQDKENRLVFTQPKQKPQRWVVIDPDFQQGSIYGNFSAIQESGFYPLEYIDIVIYSNWLANFGDFILHASGIALNDQGYCFIGDSGAGKSTLVGDLADTPGLTILGEDQVIIRFEAGRFSIYGTPWHENIDRCSPSGVPLKKVFLLDRDGNQVLQPKTGFEGVVRIMQTAFFPVYRGDVLDGIMASLASLAEKIPFYQLAYRRGSNVLEAILRA